MNQINSSDEMERRFDIDSHLSSLSDDQLREATRQAQDDLAVAARDQPNSERHEACFAAIILYTHEMQKRNLRIATVH